MPQHIWMPQQAGGVNLFEDVSSLPTNQVEICDNYYPHGRRWRMIEGNTAFLSGAKIERIRHLVEYQQDNGALGTNKLLLAMLTDGRIWEISAGSFGVGNLGTLFSTSQTLLWDSTVFTGVLLVANGVDNLNESTAGTSFAATAGSPPTAPQYVEAWKNRVFLFGRSAAPLTLYYCADGDRTTWTGADAGSEVVTSPVGDFGTAVRSVENYLAMFTRRTITLLIGDHPDNWTKRTIFEDHGTTSHRTVQKAFGGLIYANDYGVWFLNADGKRTELSRDLRPYWQNVGNSSTRRNKARSKFMHAVYDPTPNMNRYLIWVSEGTSTREEVCWIYHFNQAAWSRMVSFMGSTMACQASCLREDANGNIEPYFARGTDDATTADKNVYYIGRGATSFASLTGGNIAASLRSGVLRGDYVSDYRAMIPGGAQYGPASVKRWNDLYAVFTDGPSTGNLTFTFDAASRATLTTQQTQNIAYTGSGNIFRERVPIGVSGWGLRITVSRTGQADHDFIGGILDYDNVGTI